MSTGAALFDSRGAFQDAVRQAFVAAIERGARRIVCCDPDFADWPLDDTTLHARLVPWLKLPQRRLLLLAADWSVLPRRHPRFVTWRAPWGHAVEGWTPAEGDDAELPRVLVDDGDVFLHLRDAEHWRGRFGRDTAQAQRWRDTIDGRIERAQAAFFLRPLGL
jgi:hypothetical protein